MRSKIFQGKFENFDFLAEKYSENLLKSPNFGSRIKIFERILHQNCERWPAVFGESRSRPHSIENSVFSDEHKSGKRQTNIFHQTRRVRVQRSRQNWR